MSSSDSPPPQKRARVDSPATLPKIFVHSDIWMGDGNFILRALPADDKTVLIFKVHKSVLAACSTFFHDLFDGPQNALEAASEQYEGLPVMDMQDTNEDLHDFLNAIYFPAYTNRHRLLDKPHGFVASAFPGMYRGILELAHKYGAKGIRDVVVSSVCEEWPTQLRRWDDREALIQDAALNPPAGNDISQFYPDPVHTIRLGIKCSITSVLPVAFYDLSRVHEFDMSGKENSRTSDLDPLPHDGFKCFVRGRAALRTRLFSLEPKQNRSGACKRSNKDHVSCAVQVESFWTKRFAQIHRSSDPLDLLNLSVLPGETLNLCDGCRPVFAAAAEQRRQRLWEELPDFFNLVRTISFRIDGNLTVSREALSATTGGKCKCDRWLVACEGN
ncbi:hypothetical protein OF83DRAFT_1133643 [Amylostereum chailletii]|nr:hypothetical protein OF83DRAFT_1133643 [Amylostereum chailletii]